MNQREWIFVGVVLLAASLYGCMLLTWSGEYTDELLFLLLPPIIWASYQYQNRLVYLLAGVICFTVSVVVVHIYFHGSGSTRYSYHTIASAAIFTMIMCEILFRASYARRLAEIKNEKLISELQEALRQVKTLKGLIPICSFCKKIRDDRGYWNRLEQYLSTHSEADFTHGICPECYEEQTKKLIEKKISI